jgi:hypothetical protein
MNLLVFDIETAPLDPHATPETAAPPQRSASGDPALSALTGKTLAIGVLCQTGSYTLLDAENETVLLRDFWRLLELEAFAGRGAAVGFNIFGFDLPFLVRRSWRLGIRPPSSLREGRYWNRCFIDLLEHWALSQKQGATLWQLGRFFNITPHDAPERNFARLWRTNRNEAESRLRQDVELTMRLARLMHIAPPQPGLLEEFRQLQLRYQPGPATNL